MFESVLERQIAAMEPEFEILKEDVSYKLSAEQETDRLRMNPG